jgi:hypothetical protein
LSKLIKSLSQQQGITNDRELCKTAHWNRRDEINADISTKIGGSEQLADPAPAGGPIESRIHGRRAEERRAVRQDETVGRKAQWLVLESVLDAARITRCVNRMAHRSRSDRVRGPGRGVFDADIPYGQICATCRFG